MDILAFSGLQDHYLTPKEKDLIKFKLGVLAERANSSAMLSLGNIPQETLESLLEIATSNRVKLLAISGKNDSYSLNAIRSPMLIPVDEKCLVMENRKIKIAEVGEGISIDSIPEAEVYLSNWPAFVYEQRQGYIPVPGVMSILDSRKAPEVWIYSHPSENRTFVYEGKARRIKMASVHTDVSCIPNLGKVIGI